MKRHALLLGLFVLVASALHQPAGLGFGAPVFPAVIPLPVGFGPEGIATGNGTTFYVGSLAPATAGQILVGDLRTGEVSELVGPTGRPALGMKHDPRSDLLFVAGGPSGSATVYAASSGDQIAVYQFQPPSSILPPGIPTTLINDVVLTRDAAYFTDAAAPFLYRVALGPAGDPSEDFEPIPLPVNFSMGGSCVGPPIRANGLDATPDGKHLVVVHTSEGRLYRIDTETYNVVPIDLSTGDVCSADGLLLDGRTLYVVQNVLHRIAVVDLAPDHLSGTITHHITEPFASNPAIKVPTTIAEFGDALYAVTAGFAPPEPDVVVRLPK
jgi:DNA-binding beta-propeller fold protein YncE